MGSNNTKPYITHIDGSEFTKDYYRKLTSKERTNTSKTYVSIKPMYKPFRVITDSYVMAHTVSVSDSVLFTVIKYGPVKKALGYNDAFSFSFYLLTSSPRHCYKTLNKWSLEFRKDFINKCMLIYNLKVPEVLVYFILEYF